LLFLYNASIIRLYQILGCLKFFHINDEKRLYLLARTIKKHYFCGMKMITILGPTASGKTDIAAHLAYELGAEIISADSRQVYRGMDIGTGKDLEDYIVNGTPVPYHLIDICDAGAKYNLFQYQEDFLKAYDDITSRGVQPILCGGTGLYIESVLKGYHLSPVPQNPELRASLEGKSLEELTVMLKELKAKAGSNMHNKTDVDSCQRAIRAIEIESYNLENPIPVRDFPAIDSIIIGVNIDRDERRRKITNRLRKRLDDGMVDEIKQLLASGIPAEDLIYYGLEYKYITEYVIGKTSYDDMFRGLEIAIHQFAKRQMTWFRGMERRGFKIHWIDAMLPMDEKVKAIKELIK
jgi:tRNA dimethylallyltransferase